MFDKIDRLFNEHQWIPMLIIFLMMGTMVFGITHMMHTSVKKAQAKEDRLMKECMKDKKEYECVAMLRKNDDGDIFIMGF